MKSWCDLSWREKCAINEGRARKSKYLSGYDYRVKVKVKEGEKDDTTTAYNSK